MKTKANGRDGGLRLRLVTDWSDAETWMDGERPRLTAVAAAFGHGAEKDVKATVEALADRGGPSSETAALAAPLVTVTQHWQRWIEDLREEHRDAGTADRPEPDTGTLDTALAEALAAAVEPETGTIATLSLLIDGGVDGEQRLRSTAGDFLDRLEDLLEGLWRGTVMLAVAARLRQDAAGAIRVVESFLGQVRRVEWTAAGALARRLDATDGKRPFTGDDKLAMPKWLDLFHRLHDLCLGYAPVPSLLRDPEPPRRFVVYRVLGLVDREVWESINGRYRLDTLHLVDAEGRVLTPDDTGFDLPAWPGGAGDEHRRNEGTRIFSFWLDQSGPFGVRMVPEEDADFPGEISENKFHGTLGGLNVSEGLVVELSENKFHGTLGGLGVLENLVVEISENKFHGTLGGLGVGEGGDGSFEIGRIGGIDKVTFELSSNTFRAKLEGIREIENLAFKVNPGRQQQTVAIHGNTVMFLPWGRQLDPS